MTDEAPGEPRERAAYWTGTVAAVAGVVTAALLLVGLPVDEIGAEPDSPLVQMLFVAALASGGIALVTAPVAALLGNRRMAAWGSLGVLAWALTYAYWYATVD